jgi:hypothetical protein
VLGDRIVHEADNSAASSAEVKNVWTVPPLNYNSSSRVKGEFLGEFAKLRKATVSSVKPFRSSVPRLPWNGLSWNFLFDDFINSVGENLSVIKIWCEWLVRYTKSYTFMIISRWFILRMRNGETKVVEKIKTHILCSINFFLNSALYETMWKKICKPREATDDNLTCLMQSACRIKKKKI